MLPSQLLLRRHQEGWVCFQILSLASRRVAWFDSRAVRHPAVDGGSSCRDGGGGPWAKAVCSSVPLGAPPCTFRVLPVLCPFAFLPHRGRPTCPCLRAQSSTLAAEGPDFLPSLQRSGPCHSFPHSLIRVLASSHSSVCSPAHSLPASSPRAPS